MRGDAPGRTGDGAVTAVDIVAIALFGVYGLVGDGITAPSEGRGERLMMADDGVVVALVMV